ncbi:MAG: hypothetical protein ACPG8W_22175 [Candidatus Promineifilaceae bacterium]
MAANLPTESAEMNPSTPALDPTTVTREAELQRFNWLALYLPVILVSVIAVVLLGVLAWTALFTGGEAASQVDRASGIADVFLMLICLMPLTLVGAIVPLGGLGFLYWRQQNGSILRERTQTLLHKVDDGVATANEKVNEASPKIARPIIATRSRLEGGFVLLDKLIDAVKNGISNQIIEQPKTTSSQSEQSE